MIPSRQQQRRMLNLGVDEGPRNQITTTSPAQVTPSNIYHEDKIHDDRLLSIAKYESFCPYNLACSQPLDDAVTISSSTKAKGGMVTSDAHDKDCDNDGDYTDDDEDDVDYHDTNDTNDVGGNKIGSVRGESTGRNRRRRGMITASQTMTTSLGAIGGTHGIALFRLSQPHIPLMILSYYQMNQNRHHFQHSASSRIGSSNAFHSTANKISTSSTNDSMFVSTQALSSKNDVPSSLCFQPIRCYDDCFDSSNNNDHAGNTNDTNDNNRQDGRFSGSRRSTLYLASARGSGVLIWDVSGHSISPLTGRLGIGGSCSGVGDNSGGITSTFLFRTSNITSLVWKNRTILAGTTSNSACFWDIRQSLWRSGNSSSSARPTLRFAYNNVDLRRSAPISPYVQIACSTRDDECALLDSSGIVSIYDTRMISNQNGGACSRNSTTPCQRMYVFQACTHVGVGLAYMDQKKISSSPNTSSSDNCWLTWGFDEPPDNPQARAIVKLWTRDFLEEDDTIRGNKVAVAPTATTSSFDQDDSISSTPTPTTTPPRNQQLQLQLQLQQQQPKKAELPYNLIGQCFPPNGTDLACARVCPSPIGNTFITVSLSSLLSSMLRSEPTTETDWHVELWKIRLSKTDNSDEKNLIDPSKHSSNDDHENLDTNQKSPDMQTDDHNGMLERIASIRGGGIPSVGMTTKYIGPLCAAEVAMSSYRTDNNSIISKSAQSKNSYNNASYTNSNSCEVSGLVLCCLSENGYVTTHAIPEALPESLPDPKRNKIHQNMQKKQANNMFTKGSIVGVDETQAIDGSVVGDNEQQDEQQRTRTANTEAFVPERVLFGTAAMQFDMDNINNPDLDGGVDNNNDINGVESNPPSTSSAGIQQLKVSLLLGGGSSTDENNDHGAVASAAAEKDMYIRQATALMDRIETDRIPCPRLCGAVFSPAVGGIVCFQNGDVSKMWSWWERTDPSRFTRIPGFIGEISFTNESKEISGSGDSDNLPLLPKLSVKPNKMSTCPRTLKDLTDMIAAAKEAQWGGHESDSSSAGFFSTMGDNLFDDDSSSSDSSGNVELGGGIEVATDSAILCNTNTDEEGEANMKPSDPSNVVKLKITETAVGPTSDTLTPTVIISYKNDQLALNNQSMCLASLWKLGDMMVDNAPLTPTTDDARIDENIHYSANRKPDFPLDSFSPRGALPRYRSMLPSAPRIAQLDRKHSEWFPRNTSSTELLGGGKDATSSNAIVGKDNDSGHRIQHHPQSEVTVKREPSNLFLKNLFTNPNEREENPAFSTHLSRNDRPMLPNQLVSGEKMRMDAGQSRQKVVFVGNIASTSEKVGKRIGVYALRNHNHGYQQRCYDQTCFEIRKLCLHNARVCQRFAQYDKQDIWELLEQVVQYQHDQISSSGGWNVGSGIGALGVNLVDSVLQYYEARGDVQMLATIVCVLRTGKCTPFLEQQKNLESDKHQLTLLFSNDDERYDTYIRRYADLLYGWGLLTLRAELNKHLFRIIRETDDGCDNYRRIVSSDGSTTVIAADTRQQTQFQSGIALVFKCPRCGGSTDFGTNFCRTCQDYAFRCSICDNSVRGLFTICHLCGHGGHVDHLKAWFALQTACPTGCGCHCGVNHSALQR